VLTDGGIIFDAGGLETKRFDVRDGHGIKMMQRAGVAVGSSRRTSEVVTIRRGNWGSTSFGRGVRQG